MSKPTESGKAQYQYMEAIMLELQKKQIHMSRSKNTVSAQVTFERTAKAGRCRDGGTSSDFRKGNHKRTSRL